MKASLFALFSIFIFVNINPALAADSLFAVTVGGKLGFIDQTGKIVIKPNFIQCNYKSTFTGGLAPICTKDSDKVGYIDTTGKFVIEPKFSDARNFSQGLAAVYFGEFAMHRGYDKAGFIDKTGKLVVEPVYDDVKDFSEGLAAVTKNGKSGFIEKTGKIVIPLRFDYAFSFSDGLAAVFVNGQYGFIDKTGEILIDPQFTYTNGFSENFAMVKIDAETILPYPYSTYQGKSILGAIDTKYGFIDKKGRLVYSFTASGAGDFSDGMAAVATSDGYGFIDNKGKFAIRPGFAGVNGAPKFSGGLALVQFDDTKNDKKRGFIAQLKRVVNPKIGFIDKTGAIVIKTDYAYGGNFENGLAEVCTQINDACGYINKSGKVVWNPTK